MTVLARVVFALLVAATFSAFFVAQRLKSETPVVTGARVQRFFSPNRDGRRDAEHLDFSVKAADEVTVDVVDAAGGRARRLATGVKARPYRRIFLRWDGRTDAGARARDGRYRMRVSLRRRGRSVVVPQSIQLDTTPPTPKVVRVRPRGGRAAGRGPAIVVPGRPVDVTVKGVSRYRRTQFSVWRTDGAEPRRVARFTSRRRGARRGTWDGLIGSAPAPLGTYLIVPTVEDRAGNRGSAPRELPPQPGTVPGRPGVVVRRLAVQPPLEPQPAGARVPFFVDSQGRDYRWNVRRIGGTRRVQKGSAAPGRPLFVRAPRGPSGVYLLEVRSGSASTRVPFLVQSAERAPILVVLPAISWVGADAVDDDGDGLPNRLQDGTSVRLARPLTGLPAELAELSAPLLAFLDRAGVPYDLTTDVALAASPRDPSPADRPGVLIAGSERWIPRPLATRLRRYAERGGRVATFGTGSLRRGVTLGKEVLERPTQPTATDLFGARVRGVRRLGEPAGLITLADDPAVGLLEGASDRVGGFRILEESAPARGGPKVLAGIGQDLGEKAPLDPETGSPRAPEPALTASRLGRGLVIRVGLPEWGQRLREEPDVQQITRNVADLLRRVKPRPRSPLR